MGILKNIFKNSNIPNNRTVHMVIDEQLINGNEAQGVLDVQRIIAPLWWSVSIYDGEEKYENDLKPFTISQRYIFAIQWYSAEVNNGGHCQFYGNSTGIVWEDALKGFEAIGAEQNIKIMKETMKRMREIPSKDHAERQEQLAKFDSDFNDLDSLYYEIESEMIKALYDYIRKNTKEFMFSGEVTIPKGTY